METRKLGERGCHISAPRFSDSSRWAGMATLSAKRSGRGRAYGHSLNAAIFEDQDTSPDGHQFP